MLEETCRFAIKLNTERASDLCVLCGRSVEWLWPGPWLCVGNSPVCLACGRKHAPDLVEVLVAWRPALDPERLAEAMEGEWAVTAVFEPCPAM